MQTIWAIEKYEKLSMRMVNTWLYVSEDLARGELPARVEGYKQIPDELDLSIEEWESEKHLIWLVKRRVYETAQDIEADKAAARENKQALDRIRSRR